MYFKLTTSEIRTILQGCQNNSQFAIRNSQLRHLVGDFTLFEVINQLIYSFEIEATNLNYEKNT
ncbi:hypothetical protein COO91_09878 (plasmid) [Nostoc flagelliforme CCNUN1]|uniref:Uncharacterized protein n=1 Tax=Nostoc flagelliforme CCNUN1 TaxID=2038116 RepID=A0A2K8T7M7_9NOSO|nr:hypothetical protein COO91_09878 [Nostoc flagelliforme CCNUN1]